MSKMKDQIYFSKDWLTDPDFKNWFADTNDNTAARCKVCHKTFKLSNMGRQALTNYASVKVITNILIESNSFLNRKTVNNQKHAVAVVKIIL